MLSLERTAITSAIASTPNLNEAAKKLGASRKTLQNRMRAYDLPYGKSGRPRELLPYRSSPVSLGGFLTLAAIAGGAFLTGRWLQRRSNSNNPYLVGADILGA